MHRAIQASGSLLNLGLTLFVLCLLFVGVANVLEDAFALSAASVYITVQSVGTCGRTLASDSPPMKLQNI